MISNAEKFLVSGLKKTDCSTFDEYRWEQYHNAKKELDFNQLVCCSSTIYMRTHKASIPAVQDVVTSPNSCSHHTRSTTVWV